MCGRYTLVQWEELGRRFGVYISDTLTPRYNVAPTQTLPVIISDDEPQLRFFRWGLVPFWAKDLSIGNRLINARAETVQEKNSFRESFRRRRCLVPTDGFFEWKKDGRAKLPYYFTMRAGGLFAFAGLWDVWRSPTGEEMGSFTIITTDANDVVAPVHERMPVILTPESEKIWLDPNRNKEELQSLLVPYPADQMNAIEVSQLANSPRNDTPEILKPAR